MSGQHQKARALADQFLDLARREGSAASLRMAYMSQITGRHALGDMVGAEAYMPLWKEALARSGLSPFLGEHSTVYGVGVETAYMLGHIELARERARDFIAINEATGSPFEMASALQTAAWLEILLEAPAAAAELAARALELAWQNNFHTANQLTMTLAFATALRGDAMRGLALTEGVFDTWAGGGFSRLPEARRIMAQIRGLSGDTATSMSGLDELFAMPPDNLTVDIAHRITRGELRLAIGDDHAAEADLVAALDLARTLKTVSLELRAALPLAQVMVRQGRVGEARALLRPVCAAFAPGLGLGQLSAARGLLGQLE